MSDENLMTNEIIALKEQLGKIQEENVEMKEQNKKLTKIQN